MEPKDLKGKAIQNCPGLGALHMIEMIQYISSQTSYVLTSSYILHLQSDSLTFAPQDNKDLSGSRVEKPSKYH